MKFVLVSSLFFTLLVTFAQTQPETSCTSSEETLSYWQGVKAGTLPAGKTVDDLALELEACLASPDPDLRDRIGYELYTGWLRGGELSEATQRQLVGTLSANLSKGLGEVGKDGIFLRSFSALILSELVRADGLTSFLSDEERLGLLGTTLRYLEQERDFRGLDSDHGWIHGIAHASDILWRLAMHPATTAEDHRLILEGVASAALPEGATFYTFNEGDRLARVVVAVINRNDLPQTDITAWLTRYAMPEGMSSWPSAFTDPAGMALLHNTKLFIRALHSQLTFTSVPNQEAYLASLQTVLRILAGVL